MKMESHPSTMNTPPFNLTNQQAQAQAAQAAVSMNQAAAVAMTHSQTNITKTYQTAAVQSRQGKLLPIHGQCPYQTTAVELLTNS